MPTGYTSSREKLASFFVNRVLVALRAMLLDFEPVRIIATVLT